MNTPKHLCALLLPLLAASPALGATHPGLLYGPSDVTTLRSQAATTHAAIYASLKGGADEFLNSSVDANATVHFSNGSTFDIGDLREMGDAVASYSFVAVVSNDPKYFTLAHTWLMNVVGFGNFDLDATHDLVQAHLLAGVAVAYDLLWPQLTVAERTQIQGVLASNADALMAAGNDSIWWADEFMMNHNWINHAAVGLAALALQGEVDPATDAAWLTFATVNQQKVNQTVSLIHDGTWHEGFGYRSYGLSWDLPFVMAMWRQGTDVGDLGLSAGYGAARVHLALPEQPYATIMPHGDFSSYDRTEALPALRWAASRYGDTVAQAEADDWSRRITRTGYGPETMTEMFEFLAYDPQVASADLGAQPLDWFGDDLQAAVFRSGFGTGSTVFALKSGAYGGMANFARMKVNGAPGGSFNFSHDHADDNGFYLYGNGSWLAPEAVGYFIGHSDSPGPQANKTVFHNALTVDGEGELGEGIRNAGDEASGYTWFFDRVGGIPMHASSDHFGYARADGSKLFRSGLGMSRWDRHALFVDRKWVVIRDVVQSAFSHDYHWVCHFMDGVSYDGSKWLHGIGKNGQSLGVALIAPASPKVAVSQQVPVHVADFNPSGSVYAAEVSAAQAAPGVNFLTALVPVAESSWASRPQVAALDPAHPDWALQLSTQAGIEIVLFNDAEGQTRSVQGYGLTGLAGVVEYAGSAPTRVMMTRGTTVQDASRVLLEDTLADDFLEADGLDEATVTLSGSGLHQPRIWAPNATKLMFQGAEVPFTREGDTIVVGAPILPPVGGSDAGTPSGGGSSGSGSSGSVGAGSADAGSSGGNTGSGAASALTPGSSGPAATKAACAVGGLDAALIGVAPVLIALGGLRRRKRPR